MAKPMYNTKVGDIVYKPFKSQNCGEVLAVDKHGKYYHPTGITVMETIVTVKWLDGSVTNENELYLNDFLGLIKEHEKRLQTHKKTLNKLKGVEQR